MASVVNNAIALGRVLAVAAAAAGLCGANEARAACKVQVFAQLPVTLTNRKAMVDAKINGMDASFVVDSGAFYSMLTPASAAEYHLRTNPAPSYLHVRGIGGEAKMSLTTVKVFTLAGAPIPRVEFLVGGGEAGSGGVGLLGQNILRLGDIEYDLAKGVIRMIQADDCKDATMAYWSSATGQSVSVMDIDATSPLSPGTIGVAYVNGVKIRVMFDTGAFASELSLHAAEKAGIKVDSPGVVYAGSMGGIGPSPVKTWIAPVASFKVGDEEIRNTHLRIGESVVDSVDMLLGADFFLSHRIYVAVKRRKLFFTYNGGAVFNLTVAAAAGGAPAAVDDLNDAEQLARRGAAFAARRDFVHAIADLSRACELAPTEPNYFYERGVAYAESHQRAPALADFDRVIDLKADHVPALVARAELRADGGEAPLAIADLDAADRAAAKEADVRLRMAAVYRTANQLPQAKIQLDSWIASHAADSRLGGALGDRCWIGALSGQALSDALDDCNAALRLMDKKDGASARVFESRGLVRMRRGDYKKSIADYDASLGLRPQEAWPLYGRGIARIRSGDATAGQADIAAAKAIWPGIADAFERRGLVP